MFNSKKIKALEAELATLRIRVNCLEGKHVPIVRELTFDTMVGSCRHCDKHLCTYRKEQEQQQ